MIIQKLGLNLRISYRMVLMEKFFNIYQTLISKLHSMFYPQDFYLTRKLLILKMQH
ncbi:hypothetical protein GLOIN_2v1687898 [Rhizophagus irregularis DAOM 181602=DAOM 197198]|uniref:Uncharacterized protein n=1 Tax=Rhizophagus irregularis (strain DAOM 181602 / DAOM 197198 / MUCL 43194) TaxID=747089 RepID=A0A2P4PD15_RHIID|nr:hypothetical protein GLOIN_2v1687898 [Rhizophagus irregularis DAOM 181602=DAOM 197198]POG63273.1 hypothetical protein GLOIN_2v1687898 [Rhizophagus irregularis DAOM 181602=DAOM 197198]|eukprot:XP_025170139.1 hypothetical protein GLOIN_2v1687898 [Rhizophagus irregularis DAOM 181602=DAOM 197198]